MSPVTTVYWALRDTCDAFGLMIYHQGMSGSGFNVLAAKLVEGYQAMIDRELPNELIDADMVLVLHRQITHICEEFRLTIGKTANTPSNQGQSASFVMARELCRDMPSMMAMAAGTTKIELESSDE